MNLTDKNFGVAFQCEDDSNSQESSSQKEFRAFNLLREAGYSIDALTMLFESKYGGERFSIPKLTKGSYKI